MSAKDCRLPRVLGFGVIDAAAAVVVVGDGGEQRLKRDDGDGKTLDLKIRIITIIVTNVHF